MTKFLTRTNATMKRGHDKILTRTNATMKRGHDKILTRTNATMSYKCHNVIQMP
jgi:hypothetical protein